jgi:hypothetical protein
MFEALAQRPPAGIPTHFLPWFVGLPAAGFVWGFTEGGHAWLMVPLLAFVPALLIGAAHVALIRKRGGPASPLFGALTGAALMLPVAALFLRPPFSPSLFVACALLGFVIGIIGPSIQWAREG